MTASRRTWRMHLRVEHALLISCLIHALILSLKFDLAGLGLPGNLFSNALPQPGEVSLRVTIASQPSSVAAPSQAFAERIAPKSPVSAAEALHEFAPSQTSSVEQKSTLAEDSLSPPLPAPAQPLASDQVATGTAVAPPIKQASEPKPLAVEPIKISNPVLKPEPVPEHAESASGAEQAVQEKLRQESLRQDAAVKQEADRREVLRQEVLRQEVAAQVAAQEAAMKESAERELVRQKILHQEAAEVAVRQEAARQETARQETARQEAARQEAARQEAARQEAARQEAARQEAARQEAARQEAARQDAARQEAARQDAARQEAARQETARQDAARQDAARQDAARQDAMRRSEAAQEAATAVARAAQRDAARAPVLPTSPIPTERPSPGNTAENPPEARMETARRRTLLARPDRDLRLMMAAEGWRQKIEQNAPFDVFQAAKSGPYENPVVTVALRPDGSVESVVINRSSGVAAVDNAVRRIVLLLSPFPPFPSDLAMDYDVIEIRRVWTFDSAVRLIYGGR